MRYFRQFDSFVFDCDMFSFHLNELEWKETTLIATLAKENFRKKKYENVFYFRWLPITIYLPIKF